MRPGVARRARVVVEVRRLRGRGARADAAVAQLLARSGADAVALLGGERGVARVPAALREAAVRLPRGEVRATLGQPGVRLLAEELILSNRATGDAPHDHYAQEFENSRHGRPL